MAKLNGDGTITVEKGDYLWKIIPEIYGKDISNRDIQTIVGRFRVLNKLNFSCTIYIGQILKLPEGIDGTVPGGGTPNTGNTTTTPTNSNKPTIDHFGLKSDEDDTLFASWTWNKANTASFKVVWDYCNKKDTVWYVGSNTSISYDKEVPSASKQSTFKIPDNAWRVRFKVKPISETQTKNNKETSYWEAEWSTAKIYTISTPITAPSVPTVTIDKYTLTATLDKVGMEVDGIQFEVRKAGSTKTFKTGKSTIINDKASFTCTVTSGEEYIARCRATMNAGYAGEWSDWSTSAFSIPAAPSGITTIKASSETSVYLEWAESKTATGYEIEYTTKKEYFDASDQTTTKTGIEYTKYDISGLETGQEYFFRVRAVSNKVSGDNYSGWSDIKSVVLGKKPTAPTTWSSTTTAVVGKDKSVILYWMHNSVDGSSQTFANLEITINGVAQEPITINNDRPEEDKDKTSSYELSTSNFVDGTKIKWRVQTAGVTKECGDWSVEREITIYEEATLLLSVQDKEGSEITSLANFPFIVSAVPYPETQAPIGYYVTIVANETYETTDNVGNSKIVSAGDQVYSKYYDINQALLLEISANSVNLENNISYTITATVAMDSGLKADASKEFVVLWDETITELMLEMTEIVFTYNFDYSAYVHTIDPSPFDLVEGESYKIVWDEKEYTRTAVTFTTQDGQSYVAIGNPLTYGGENNTDRFTVVYDSTNNLIHIFSLEIDAKHTIAVFHLFTVDYTPNAEIAIDPDTLVAYITPYCENHRMLNYVVIEDVDLGTFRKSDEVITEDVIHDCVEYDENGTFDVVENEYGETETGEQIYKGLTSSGETVLYCMVEERTIHGDTMLAVYRREFDGSFTEIASGLDSAKSITVADPHPALDFARYRIVATDRHTGAVTFTDLPGYPIGGKAVIIQWDEDWSSFEVSEDEVLEQPPWSGSMLKLPYNVDFSESTNLDVSLVEYVGREHPISYYGTHVGQTSTCNLEVEKSDKETVYALRRLQRWMGNVYIREPSGAGYWATISVNFSQKHCELTIPVTISITRVEGGV